jgi:hypothetical protein
MPNEATVKQWEAFLATSPLGVSYGGGQTGKVSPALQNAHRQLVQKIQSALNRPLNITLDQPPTVAQNLVGEVQKKQQAEQPAPQQPPQEQPKTGQGELVKAWRGYLKVGDPNNPQSDPQLAQAITAAETKISSVIPSAKGIIWQGNQINPQVPPAEYDAALKLLQQHSQEAKPAETEPKTATAMPTLDALGPPPTREEQPMATKFVMSDEDTKIQTGDPRETQQQGITAIKLPAAKKKRKRKGRKLTMDERLLRLVDLMAETKKS